MMMQKADGAAHAFIQTHSHMDMDCVSEYTRLTGMACLLGDTAVIG